jgi:hypothetical protein
VTEKAKCGTAHCAFGWAMVDPWFIANTSILDAVHITKENSTIVEFDETAKIFNLSEFDIVNLFGTDLYVDCPPHAVSKEEVLENIAAILAGNPSHPYAAVKITW